MLLVLSIVGILMALGMFPYAEYMRQASLSSAVDTVAQEWILAHKEVRNGILFDDTTSDEKHAHIVIAFEKNTSTIREYLLSGGTLPISLTNDPNSRLHKTFDLERGIIVQAFSGITTDTLYYLMAPPYATGSFFDGTRMPLNTQEVILQIGYPGSQIVSGRAKEILLKPYLQ